jgi:hypothetical protein
MGDPMNRVQIGAVASLLLVAMTIAVLVSVLSERKTVLAAEGADLRTTESIWVSASLRELRLHAGQFGAGTRVFKSLDDTTRAVELLAGAWDDVPLHSGSPLGGITDEALAGSRRAPDRVVLEVAGESYRIVGRLGVRADSLLADEAVITGSDLFDDDRERLRIDGPRVADRYRAAFPGRPFEVVDSGVNRRTNVDVVTPFLFVAGVATAVLVTVSGASYAVRRECRAARVRFVVGQRRRRLLVMATLRMVLATVCPAVTALALGLTLGGSLLVRPELVPVLAVISVVAMSLVVLGVWNGVRRWS